jgi:hypothetical protein
MLVSPQEIGLTDQDINTARQASRSWKTELGNTVESVTLFTQDVTDQELRDVERWFPSYTTANVLTIFKPGSSYEADAIDAAIRTAASHTGLDWLKLKLHFPNQPFYSALHPEQHPLNCTQSLSALVKESISSYWRVASAALAAHGGSSIKRLHVEQAVLPPAEQLAALSALKHLSHLHISGGPASPITSALIQAVAQITGLSDLHITGSFSPNGVSFAPLAAPLPDLSSLQLLNSYPEAIPTSDLASCVAARTKLRKLGLQRLEAPSVVPSLLGLPDLQHLLLTKCDISEEGYLALGQLERLTSLTCDYHLAAGCDVLPATPAWRHMQELTISVRGAQCCAVLPPWFNCTAVMLSACDLM